MRYSPLGVAALQKGSGLAHLALIHSVPRPLWRGDKTGPIAEAISGNSSNTPALSLGVVSPNRHSLYDGPMKRTPSLLGALYTCDRCDAHDPIEGSARKWVESELRPLADWAAVT
jgi:hypothetical protein